MDEDESEEQGGGGLDPELIRSYVRFVTRALGAHRLLIAIVMVLGVSLSVGLYKFLPRTFSCTTVLMVDGSRLLEDTNIPSGGLVAAENLIMRHDNLESIIREIDLMRTSVERRPPLIRVRDNLFGSIFGEPSEERLMQQLVGTLESKIHVKVDNGTLTVSAEWSDARTASELAGAARESYVKTRHVAEISAFEEKLSILEGHATSLREEVESLAKQARTLIEDRAKNQRDAHTAASTSAAAATDDAPAPVLVRTRPRATEGDDDVGATEMKARLEEKKKKLAEFDRDREQRIAEERRKIDDLKLKLTPNHPDVVTAQQRLALLEQEPSEISLLRAEVSSLEGELKQRDLLARAGKTTLVPGMRARGGGQAAGAMFDPLPGDIVQLLDAGNIDPALAASLSSAVGKYAALRDEIRNGHINFDTAQAAFNFRYRVVVPNEPPKGPIKPKGIAILGGGLAATILLALLLPLLAELRTGVMVERWQVAMVELPVLADLRLPPSGAERAQNGPASTRH